MIRTFCLGLLGLSLLGVAGSLASVFVVSSRGFEYAKRPCYVYRARCWTERANSICFGHTYWTTDDPSLVDELSRWNGTTPLPDQERLCSTRFTDNLRFRNRTACEDALPGLGLRLEACSCGHELNAEKLTLAVHMVWAFDGAVVVSLLGLGALTHCRRRHPKSRPLEMALLDDEQVTIN